ncbi:cytidine deaminase [Clostridia bacterium]|nr:cytidine deaminase [Clostridia bacterium]
MSGFDTLIERAKTVQNERILSEGTSVGYVAAALLSEGGNVYVGVNIDVFCGMGFCAEHSAIAAMVAAGESVIRKIVAICPKGILPPCGRCREFMSQINAKNLDAEVMIGEDKVVKLNELLPYRWDERS